MRGAWDRTDLFSREELQSVIEFLADDLLEGRAPGTRGGRLAELYVQSVFKLMGLRLGFEEGYLQPFELVGNTTRDVSVQMGGAEVNSIDDVLGVYLRDGDPFELEGEAVFAGFGIRTPIWEWDDFKGADLEGKVLVVRAGDPGRHDPALFEGAAPSHFGRLVSKVEEAQRAGARAVLMVHSERDAGYDWDLVRRSWDRENAFLPAERQKSVVFRGLVSETGVRRLLATGNVTLEDLYRNTLSRQFEPVPLGTSIRIAGRNSSRRFAAANVVAEIPGLSDRRVVLSAHIDHIGHRPDQPGRNVFNGAIDNGSAVAALVLAARALNEFRDRLPCTVTVLACGAEEAGLLGSTHYVQNADRSRILAAINFESTPVWERSRGVFAVGAHFSTLEDMLEEIADEEGLEYSGFSMGDQGFFYRSDHFPFALRGIPAVWLSAGEAFAGGTNHLKEFFTKTYHTVDDRYDPSWELESLRQTVRLAVMLVDRIGRSPEPPRWKTRLVFPTDEG